MFNFDFIDAASFGYRAVWLERKYLFRMALIPILIKFACTVAIFALGYETNFLRQGLIMLPAMFAEGWLLAQFLRTLLLFERWPIVLKHEPSEAEIEALLIRARGIMACTIMYVLISFLDYGIKEGAQYLYAHYYAAAEQAASSGKAVVPTRTDTLMLIPSLVLLLGGLWAFRFIWLYIPLAVLMRVGIFLRVLGGYMASVRMLGLFLICIVPCTLLAFFLTSFIVSVTGGPESDLSKFLLLMISVIAETIAWLIATAAMAYACRDILPKHPKALPDIKNEN